MRLEVFFLALGALLLRRSAFAHLREGSDHPRVRLLVFSGTRDPEWVLSAQQVAELQSMLASTHATGLHSPAHILGYRGFHIFMPNSANPIHVARNHRLEMFLLSTAPAGVIAAPVMEHVKERIVHGGGGSVQHERAPARPHQRGGGARLNVDCSPPVVGPDTPPQDYDPETDDRGCFEEEQYENNCYNYGNDVVTNSFAQPGRGSGTKFSRNDCDNVGSASSRDGLVWVGKDLPAKQPDVGHHVALFIWPESNFHWIRRDGNGTYWSHKPGGTQVRNTDNRGAHITDPSQSDFSPWTTFCGYYISVPSNVTIS